MALGHRLADVRSLRFAMRARAMWGHREMVRQRPGDALRHLFRSAEIANFTYELANEDEISEFLAELLGAEEIEVRGYLDELRADEELIQYLRLRLTESKRRDGEPLLGKRRLQYCIARAEKPRVTVESGVFDGLGTEILLRALERNEAEGSAGRLVALDINPEAGWLVDKERHANRYEFVPGDAKETLPFAVARETAVDFFVHDSLKTLEHETFELETALKHRGGRQVLYSDDAHATRAMEAVAAGAGAQWGVFQERPMRHYWRGNPLGVCVVPA